MRYPTTKFERQALTQGFWCIAGIDEVGRGAWAGPVVAAAVLFDINLKNIPVTDSKLLTANQREILYQQLTKHTSYGIGVIAHQIIDMIGIVPATRLAMIQAIAMLPQDPDYLLIDAMHLSLPTSQQAIIKGDQKSWSIAAASIIAKVTRDQIMMTYDQQYPHYGFATHKGYGTSRHQRALKKWGICPLHRVSFRPIEIIR